jgi:beta-lactam-binding protein with PASTA domain
VAEPPVQEDVVVERRRPPNIAPWLVAALFAALAIAALVWALSERGPKTAHVPRVVGEPRATAIARIHDAGFRVKVKLETHSTASGRVLDQAPQADAVLEKGSKVYVAVSRGPAVIAVPKLIGLRSDGASRLLTSLKLVPQPKTVPSNKPKDVVVAQSPPTSEKVSKGTIVFFDVSRGPQLVAVPALRGLTQQKANAKLQAAGLKGTYQTVPSAEPAGTVVAQEPVRGAKVKPGTAVRVNVSAGNTGGTTTVTTTTVTATTLPATTTAP